MDAPLIQSIGEIAGAGGTVLLLLTFFFREILTSKFSEKLGRQQASRLINLMIWIVLGLALGGGAAAFLAPVKHGNGCSTSTANVTVTQGNDNTSFIDTGCRPTP
jgi:hypothetical protein